MKNVNGLEFKKGGRYNWVNQKERLIYLGHNWSGNGYWHQFALVEEPNKVWCEVQDEQLNSFEATPEEKGKGIIPKGLQKHIHNPKKISKNKGRVDGVAAFRQILKIEDVDGACVFGIVFRGKVWTHPEFTEKLEYEWVKVAHYNEHPYIQVGRFDKVGQEYQGPFHFIRATEYPAEKESPIEAMDLTDDDGCRAKEELNDVRMALLAAEGYSLVNEVVWSALKAMQKNPKLTIDEVMVIGLAEWDL